MRRRRAPPASAGQIHRTSSSVQHALALCLKPFLQTLLQNRHVDGRINGFPEVRQNLLRTLHGLWPDLQMASISLASSGFEPVRSRSHRNDLLDNPNGFGVYCKPGQEMIQEGDLLDGRSGNGSRPAITSSLSREDRLADQLYGLADHRVTSVELDNVLTLKPGKPRSNVARMISFC